MELASIGSQTATMPNVAALQDNEAAERVPDNEASESPKANPSLLASAPKAPLPSYAGTMIDTQA